MRYDVEDCERWALRAAVRHLERDLEWVAWEGLAWLLLDGALSDAQRAGGSYVFAAVVQSVRGSKRLEVDEVRVAVVHKHDVLGEKLHAYDAVFLDVITIVGTNAFVDPCGQLEDVDYSVGSLALIVIVWEGDDDRSFVSERTGLLLIPSK